MNHTCVTEYFLEQSMKVGFIKNYLASFTINFIIIVIIIIVIYLSLFFNMSLQNHMISYKLQIFGNIKYLITGNQRIIKLTQNCISFALNFCSF